MTLGTRVAVMREGRLAQVAPPLELYERPVDTFVATFIGSPPMNLLPAAAAGIPAAGATVGIRPHDVVIDTTGPVAATVDVVEPRGHDTVVHLKMQGADDPPILAVVSGEPPQTGSRVRLAFPPDRLHLFDARGARMA